MKRKLMRVHSVTAYILSLFLVFLVMSEVAAKDLELKTVVIDAGHGGKDPGGVSKDRKTYEKNLVLDIAKRLGTGIKEKYPDVKVIYTRSTDVYITLNERAAIANRNNADLFISIHTNASSSSSVHGTSVHILGESSNPDRDLYASNLDVCRRENSVILLEDDYSTDYQGFDPNSPESFIFFNLMQNAHYEHSVLFAAEVDKQLRKTDFAVSNYTGIHQDPFWLLWKTSMPAVLLELGFISNPADLKVLTSVAGREDIASKLLTAFSNFKKYYDSSVDVDKTNISVSSPAPSSSADPKIYYGIQIMGLGRVLPEGDPALKGYEVSIVKSPGSNINRYVTGSWPSVSEAEKRLKSVQAKFPGAYIVKVDGTSVVRAK